MHFHMAHIAISRAFSSRVQNAHAIIGITQENAVVISCLANAAIARLKCDITIILSANIAHGLAAIDHAHDDIGVGPQVNICAAGNIASD